MPGLLVGRTDTHIHVRKGVYNVWKVNGHFSGAHGAIND